MRKLLLSVAIICLCFATFAQHKALKTSEMRNHSEKMVSTFKNQSGSDNGFQINNLKELPPEEFQVGNTFYDLQSNSSCQNRIYKYGDGTIGAVWTRGMIGAAFADRGTGYNYYDGTAWAEMPTARIENVRTGWPSYCPVGANGEIVAAHHNTAGIVITKRAQKGTGTWAQSILAGPTGAIDISWPRMITSGTDHNNVHILASTYSAYQGLDLALLYYRSTDGGNTWDIQHQIIPGMSSSEYYGFNGDTYTWAEPKGNLLAFVMGDSKYDLFLMKSTDNGSTWSKTVIWEHPYPMWDGVSVTDTFYCPDGTHSVLIDDNGKCHVAFGINRANSDGTSAYWFPGVGGIAYWNEDLPTWTGGNQFEALNPENLDASGNLIGYEIDINGNGTWDILDATNIAKYYVGSSSFPQLVMDNQNRLVLVYSSITENMDNGSQNYRHLWCRGSADGGNTWSDNIIDLTGDILHNYDECVFPSVAANADDHFYLVYQADEEPGLALRGDEDPYADNRIPFMKVLTDDIIIPVVINPPTNLQLALNYNDVTLNWTAPTGTGLQGYDAYRNGTKINTSLITTTTYQDLDLGYGAYSYCVKAVYETATSDCSNTVQTTVLLKPLNLTADANGYTVTLNWDAPFKGLTGYNVYRDDVKITDTPITVNTFTEDVAIGSFDYTVTAVYSEGESVASDPVTVVINSINDPIAKSIKVYPNPVKDQLNVVSGAEINRIVITNHVGQVVFESVINSNNFSMNTSNYQNGVYMINIYTGNCKFTKKIMIN